MSCHFSLSCYCRAIHSLISYHPPRISVAMNWSSGAVNGSQRTQRRCELWNGSSIRGCRPHFIPPMGTMVTNWVELLFIVLIIKHSWPSFSSRGGVLTPSITPKHPPHYGMCASFNETALQLSDVAVSQNHRRNYGLFRSVHSAAPL